jgi:hypothetical protein
MSTIEIKQKILAFNEGMAAKMMYQALNHMAIIDLKIQDDPTYVSSTEFEVNKKLVKAYADFANINKYFSQTMSDLSKVMKDLYPDRRSSVRINDIYQTMIPDDARPENVKLIDVTREQNKERHNKND